MDPPPPFSAPQDPPLVAILRGVRPDEIVDIATALYAAGLRMIEVPLNSPDPLESVARLARALGDRCLCGAGTVLSAADVDSVRAAGGRLIVTPNTDPDVIARAVSLGLVVMPGFATATEAFAAVRAGARALKLFPAASYGPGHLKALKSVLPRDAPVYAVGGVGPAEMGVWRAAGADGFGVGGELYRPGQTAAETGERARALIAAWRALGAGREEDRRMTEPLRIGLVGVGKIARDQHIPAIAASADLTLVAAASRHFPPGDEGFARHETLARMLDAHSDLDAVVLCTPPQARHDLAALALSRGKHVFLEKPPGATLSEVEA